MLFAATLKNGTGVPQSKESATHSYYFYKQVKVV